MNTIKRTLGTMATLALMIIGIMIPDRQAYAQTYYLNGHAVEETTDESLKATAAREFANMPTNVTSRFTEMGWKYVVLEDGGIARAYDKKPGWVIDGLNNGVDTIYVNGSIVTMDTLYHEMGHFIDDKAPGGNVSTRTEFAAIFAAEGSSLTAYGSTSAREFFAEVVMGMYTDPVGTRSRCPKAYDYATEVIRNF